MDKQLQLLMQLHDELTKVIIQSVVERWPPYKVERAMTHLINKLKYTYRHLQSQALDDKMYNLWIVNQRVYRNLSTNIQEFYSEFNLNRDIFYDSLNNLKQLAKRIDRVFTVQYKDGSKHHFMEYMQGVLDYEYAKKESKIKYDDYIANNVVFVMVSTEFTNCFICTPWLGTTGTIGQDVEGFPRLDDMFPIHYRCIHRIIPCGADVIKIPPPDWVLTADRKEYYRRFTATTEGREIMREQERLYDGGTKRIKSILFQLINNIK